jgi:hypothetical protein
MRWLDLDLHFEVLWLPPKMVANYLLTIKSLHSLCREALIGYYRFIVRINKYP